MAQYNGDWRTPLDCKYFYMHDRLGSVRQIMDCHADIDNHYTYDPFGLIFATESTENTENSFKFTGQYLDAETHSYYLRARMYDPHLSRFTHRDPVLGDFAEPLTLHKYLYCRNNPLLFKDLNGKWAFAVGMSLSANFTFGGIDAGLNLHHTLDSTAGVAFKSMGLIEYYCFVVPMFTFMVDHIGLGGTAGGSFVFAHDEDQGPVNGWSFGMMYYAAGGISASTSSSFSASGEFNFSYSDEATSVEDLGGWFAEVGGSITTPIPVSLGFLAAGATKSYGLKSPFGEETGINMFTISLGMSTPGNIAGYGGEYHGYLGYTLTETWFRN